MNPTLRTKLLAAAAGGAVSIAVVLGDWFEGVRYTPYRDPAGILTVCRGVTGPDVVPGRRYTEAECRQLEAKHLAVAEAAVRRQIPGYAQLNDWQRAALIDFAYNVGEPALAGSTLRRKFVAGDVVGGCAELARWVHARVDGQLRALPGLVERRGAEQELCLHWRAVP